MRKIHSIYTLEDKEKELFYEIFKYDDQTMDIKIYNKNKKYLHKIVNQKSKKDERADVEQPVHI